VQDGFTGITKAFGTSGNSNFGSGNNGVVEVATYSATAGFGGGGGLSVDVGYRPGAGGPLTGGGNNDRRSGSAGWSKAFNMASAGTLHLSFRHRLLLSGALPSGEWGETTLQIDTTKYGTVTTTATNGATYPAGWKAVSRTTGTGAATVDSGWQQYVIDIPLAAGNHNFILGAFSNTTVGSDDHVQGFFDDIVATMGGSGGSVLGNDTGGAVSAALVANVAHGTLVFNTDGTFSYTPALNFTGIDTFTYTASDGVDTSAPATVTITVTPVNDAPVAVADAYSTPEDTQLVVPALTGVLANDADVDGDTITSIINTNPTHGVVTLTSNGSFTYTPTANYSGPDSFSYHARDAALNSNVVTVSFTVTPVNDTPVAAADSYTVPFNGSLTITDINGISVTENLILGTERAANGLTIVTPGSDWKYFSAGTAPPDTVAVPWTSLAYDDSTWLSGPSELEICWGKIDPKRRRFQMMALQVTSAVPSHATRRLIFGNRSPF
jgi:VCBS repeat-containing protein